MNQVKDLAALAGPGLAARAKDPGTLASRGSLLAGAQYCVRTKTPPLVRGSMGHRAASVAGHAIRLAIRDGSFKNPDVRRQLSDAPSRQTVTRILQQLEEDGWLERDGPNSSIWRAGRTARVHGDMGDAALRRANREARGPDTYDRENP